MKTQRSAPRRQQGGGFFLGLIVGLLIGLAMALGVALYIAKVPVPFVNKVPQRTAEQDAAEAAKNRNWDPNSALYSKTPVRSSNIASGVVTPPPAPPVTAATPAPAILQQSPATPPAIPPTLPPVNPTAASPKDNTSHDPAAILADKAPASVTGTTLSTKPSVDALSYFVQAGAYGRVEDAEQQRAKLAMMGLAAKITEREQTGRTVYRVRLGPFDRKEEASVTKEKLEGAGIESALVQVQK